MIPKDCKRLAEVDFPIAEVSRHAAKEKSIRHGHPSTLHLWWARRPLASSRAVLLALLWPDPCESLCPAEFKEKARSLLPQIPNCNPGETDQEMRQALLKFIADFANWDLASNRTYLDVSRALVKAAHGDKTPLVVDPFAGGGSIPLEALRLGCEAFASDLNPVACLILKVMLEDIPRRGPEFAQELRSAGADIKRSVANHIGYLYPKDPDGATPIAYRWARSVRCESPNCGAEIPIFKSPWLSKKGAKRARYFRERAEGRCVALLAESHPLGGPVRFRIARGDGSEDPRPGFTELSATKATGNNANVVCPCCGSVLPGNKKNPRTSAQLTAQHGGSDVEFDANGRRIGGARMLAVVVLRPGEIGRQYRLPTDRDYEAVREAQERLAKIVGEWERGGKRGLCPVPDESTPAGGGSGAGRAFSVQRYGMFQWRDLFTARQSVTLNALSEQLAKVRQEPANEDLVEILAIALSRVSDIANALCSWKPSMTQVIHVFTRQALPVVWDFAEASPLGAQAGDFTVTIGNLARILEGAVGVYRVGQVQLADAAEHPLPDETAAVWFTDPPYYDAVPYADLSDFFFAWLKRALPSDLQLRDPFDPANPLTPKRREIVQDETKYDNGRPKDRAWFEESMARAFAEGRRVLEVDGVGSVVFAHKTTEGWEALLSGMIRGGWTITGSWPIATEMGSRLRARESAALATSVHLICRPRPGDAPIGDWADVLRELPKRVSDWMERLQGEGVRGADLVFACIGPALEIFSRHPRVETAEGREVALAEYLEKVWEAVGRSALAQVLGTTEAKARNGAAGAVEEDARLTALFLWTLQSTNGSAAEDTGDEDDDEETTDEEDDEGASRGKPKGFTLVFDVVRRFAQPLGIDLPKWEGRVIEIKKGVVRLLPVAERAKQLFGEDGAQAVATRLELETGLGPNPLQRMLFPEMEITPKTRGRGARGRSGRMGVEVSEQSLAAAPEATTLDRVHAAMLLQAGGRTNALRALLKAEDERGPDFLRLANALSALYPKGSEEKRLLDAMLLAAPR